MSRFGVPTGYHMEVACLLCFDLTFISFISPTFPSSEASSRSSPEFVPRFLCYTLPGFRGDKKRRYKLQQLVYI
ncbi:hypothetical protein BRADI_3g59045v3 [Brachypodium distachyon]|uniref:Uncharacterized protein n=1 Tax=Brachypodium distachyon TaxID=15368 RepID=A0A2K2D5R5_BRADI|nr:hypothetical protein BRADI_3g59045v3 [Brachypodium distachyon]PNT69625.1 hypothetical protein BRADI_3g59045v3 [Brachypodium distachyon]